MKGLRGSEQTSRMAAEPVIADALRRWTETVIPGDGTAAGTAVRYATETFTSGASLTDAYEAARRMVIWRSHHPSVMGAAREPIAATSRGDPGEDRLAGRQDARRWSGS